MDPDDRPATSAADGNFAAVLSRSMLDAYPPGFNPDSLETAEDSPAANFDNAATATLFASSNWKARKEALDRIYRRYAAPRGMDGSSRSNNASTNLPVWDDATFDLFVQQLPKLAKENNASVQEAILDVALVAMGGSGDDDNNSVAVAETAADASPGSPEPLVSDADAKQIVESLGKLLVEKGLVGRAKALQTSQQLILRFVENAQHEEIMHTLLTVGLTHRTPKNKQQSLAVLALVIQKFGVANLPLKPIIKAVIPTLSDANVQVRKEAQSVLSQVYLFIGANIKNHLADLREAQMTELMKTLEPLEVGQARPQKTIKGFGPAKLMKVLSMSAGQAAAANGAPVDDETFQSFDESVILSKLPKSFFTNVLDKTVKWQDRVALFKEHLLPLLAAPRFRASDDYTELTKCLRDMFVDPQAPVMLAAIEAIIPLARGLRTAMSPYVRFFVSALLDKFKDKKGSVVEHVQRILSTFFSHHCTTMDAFMDEIELVATTSKVPNQRQALLSWLLLVAEQVEKQQLQRLQRSHATLLRLVNDEKGENRELALQLVAKLLSLFGERPMQTLMNGLDAKQTTKVLVACSSLQNNNNNNNNNSGENSLDAYTFGGDSPSTSSPMKKVARVERTNSAGVVKPLTASSLSAQRRVSSLTTSSTMPPTGSMSTSMRRASNANPTAAAAPAAAEDSGLPTAEEAMNTMIGLTSETPAAAAVAGGCGAKEWKTRLESLQALAEWVQSTWNEDMCAKYADALVVFLKQQVGWKESIFQVFNAALALLSDVVGRAATVSHGSVLTIILGATPKITEVKNKPFVRSLLTLLVEAVGPKMVLKHVIALTTAAKNPKLAQEVNDWLLRTLVEFDQAPVDAKAIADYVKLFCFEQSAPLVKSSAIQLVVVLRQRVGARFDALFADVNPHVKASIEAEVARGPPALLDVVPRQVKGAALAASSTTSPFAPAAGSKASSGGAAERRGTNAAAVAEDDFPRVDVSAALNLCSKDIQNGKDWQARLAAMKKMQDVVIQAHENIAPGGVSDALKALRTRFDESNKNVVVDALKTISLLCKASGAQGSRLGLKSILPAVFTLLGDQKQNLREEAARVSHMALDVLGLEHILPMLGKPLTAEALSTRQTAIDLLDKASQQGKMHTVGRPMLSAVVPPVLRLAMDRTVEVRAAAERVTGVLMPLIGTDPFQKGLMDLKPAEQQSVRPMLERRLAASQATPTGSIGTMNQSEPPSIRSSMGDGVVSSSQASLPPGRGAGGPTHAAAPLATPSYAPLPQQSYAAAAPSTAAAPHAHVPTTMTRLAPPPTTATAAAVTDTPRTTQEIVLGLRSASSAAAFKMCTDFMKRFLKGEDCGTVDMMRVMVDRLCQTSVAVDADLALGLINCLTAMFDSPRSALRCNSDTLVVLFGQIFACLLSEPFSVNDTVIKALNNMTLKMLEGCQVNELCAALMMKMDHYSAAYLQSNAKVDHKFVQVVVKCLMRLEWDSVGPDVAIMCCHDYLDHHPPSAFKARDDISVRTVKTILQNVSRKHGRELLEKAEALVGAQNLVSHFVRACLEHREKALRADQTASSPKPLPRPTQQHYHTDPNHPQPQQAAAAPPAAQQQTHPEAFASRSTNVMDGATATTAYTASTVGTQHHKSSLPTGTPYASTPVPHYVIPTTTAVTASGSSTAVAEAEPPRAHEEPSVSVLFSRIRNHTTTNEGVDALYRYVVEHGGTEEFDIQFNKCSDAFRSFVKRRLEKAMADDPKKPPNFSLPEVVLRTS